MGLLQFTRNRYPADSDAIWRGEPQYLVTDAYPDKDFDRVLKSASEQLSKPASDLLREFGFFAAATTFHSLYPEFYEESGGTRQFLLDVEGRIHRLVRKSLPLASPPKLHVVAQGDHGVEVTYTSERGLCDLVDGLIRGTADYYQEHFAVEHPQCMRRGDPECAFFVDRA
jgi:predicted hydrocarbon binding protein